MPTLTLITLKVIVGRHWIFRWLRVIGSAQSDRSQRPGAREGVRRPQRADVRLHPMFFTLSLLAMLFALSRAIANYHVIR